jgi:radical SAM/Cys-rich protein
VLFEPGQEDTADFLAGEGVDIVASLPCYTASNVDAQRGKRVYERSIEALRRLNALGYGAALRLDLVYNPLGPALPAPQAKLEADYRRELGALGIRFDRLLTLTNMPIKRFARDLARRGESEAYQSLLVNHFNPGTVDALMCRSTLSVAFDGQLYDCDFNQALGLPLAGRRATLYELEDVAELEAQPVATALHCFGCTAGAGSSCGGALAP